MADDEAVDREVAERARALYWSSARSVNSIANDLGLSKGRLYGLIDPLPAGIPCPRCGTEMVYETRSAKDKGTPSCPVCAAEARGKRPPVAARPTRAAEAPAARPEVPPGGSSRVRSESQPRPRPEGSPDRPEMSNTKILAGLLLGAFAGLLLYRLVRRRPE